jgi:Spy/CpxP family protein refolding chaperone
MLRKTLGFAGLVFFFCAWPLLAQTDTPPSSAPPARPAPAHREPCWQQAGIEKSVVEQHRAIEHEAHSQIAAVCEDSSLNLPQKRQQVQQIRQQAQQKVDALLTPEQQQSLRACQQQRGENYPTHGRGGPCAGEWSRQQAHPNAPATGSSNSSPDSNSTPQN